MTHYHEMPDGARTGDSIIDEDIPSKHYHMLNGVKSSVEDNSETHSHTIDGQLTGRPIEVNDSKKGNDMSNPIETKRLGGALTQVKETERAGVKIGIVEGYIATWDTDLGDYFGIKDQFVKGCFRESIADHLTRGRQIRLKDHHGRTVGGFPIDSVREDDRGLWGSGEINLDVQQGRELYALALQGVLTDFSIGFCVEEFSMDGDLRIITKSMIIEGSVVDDPMNPKANITSVKSTVPYQDLPLADKDRSWDADAATGRVRELTDSEEEPGAKYKNAFLWYDRENSNTFAAYKLPIADVVDGSLRAVPRAIFAAAAAMAGARGGVDIPESDRPGVIRHIERYYAKMDMPSPFEEDDKQYFIADDVEKMDVRTLEKALRKTGCFSKSAGKLLAKRLTAEPNVDDEEDLNNTQPESKSFKEIIDDLNGITKSLASSG